MAFLAPILGAIGGGIATGAGAIASALPTILSVAGTGLSALSSAGVFGGKGGGGGGGSTGTDAAALAQAKDRDAQAAEEKKRQALVFGMAAGRGSTILTSGRGLTASGATETDLKKTLGG